MRFIIIPCSVSVERRRPVPAITVITTRKNTGKENIIAIRSSTLEALDIVVGCMSPNACVTKFFPLLICRHTPIATPIGGGGIVGAFQLGLIVDEASFYAGGCCRAVFVDVFSVCAIFEFVVRPRIGGLGGRFAPGKFISFVPRIVSSDVACRPKGAGWEAEVDVFVSVFRNSSSLYNCSLFVQHGTNRIPFATAALIAANIYVGRIENQAGRVVGPARTRPEAAKVVIAIDDEFSTFAATGAGRKIELPFGPFTS